MHVKYKRAEVIRSRCTPAHGSDFLFCKTEQTTQTHDTLICQMLILQSLRQFSWQSQAPRYRHNETQSQVQFWRLLTALELLRYILFAFQNFVAGMVSIMSTLSRPLADKLDMFTTHWFSGWKKKHEPALPRSHAAFSQAFGLIYFGDLSEWPGVLFAPGPRNPKTLDRCDMLRSRN